MRRLALIFVLGLAAAAAAGYLLAPRLLEDALRSWAQRAGYDHVALDIISVNPILGRATVDDLELGAHGVVLVRAQRVDADLSVRALLEGALRIELVALLGARLAVRADDAGITAGGIALGARGGGVLAIDRLVVRDGALDLATPAVTTALHVNELEISEGRHIVADTISARDLRLGIVRDGPRSWRLDSAVTEAMPPSSAQTPVRQTPVRGLLPAGVSLKIARLQLSGESIIDYRDTFLSVPLADTLYIDEAYVADIDTQAPDRAVSFLLREHGEDGARSTWRGEAYPFRAVPELTLTGELESFQLKLLSQILEQAAAVTVTAGRVDGRIALHLLGDALDGTLALHARGLALQAQGEPVLEVGEASATLSLSELSRGELRVASARLAGGRVEVQHLDDGSLRVAGLPLHAGAGRQTATGAVRVAIDDLELSDAEVHYEAPRTSAVFRVNAARLREGRHLVVDTVGFHDVQLRIERTDVMSWLLGATGEGVHGTIGDDAGPGAAAPPPGEPAAAPGDLTIAIARVEITGESFVEYKDTVVGVPIINRYNIEEAYLTDIDTQHPERPVTLFLRERGPSGPRSTWRGEMFPFKEPFDLTLAAEIGSIELKPLSALAERAWGVEVASGSASGALDLRVIGEELSGSYHVRTKGLQLVTDGEQVLSVGDATLDVSLAELLRGQLRLTSARLEGGWIKAEQSADGTLTLAGLVLERGADSASSAGQQLYSIGELRVIDTELFLQTPVLRLGFHVDTLELIEGQALSVDTITVRDVNLGIVRQTKDGWQLLGEGERLAASFGFGAGAYSVTAAQARQPLAAYLASLDLRVARIDIAGDSAIRYEDTSGPAPYRARLSIEQASLTNVDNRRAGVPATWALRLVGERHASFDVQGSIDLFSELPAISATGTLSALELTPLSPLTAAVLGFDIDTGQLDGKFRVSVDAGQIDGQLDLRANYLTVSTADRKKLRTFERRLHDRLTLNQIVYYLTDRDGVLAIGVPVSGDARAPTFGVDVDMDAAIRRAIRDITGLGLLAVAPVITAAVRAMQTRRPRFATILFPPLGADLDDAARAALKQVAEQLVEGVGAVVLICGKVADRDFQQAPQESIKPVGASAWRDLGQRRADAVKDYLIASHGIEPRRLIACRPSVERSRASRSQDDLRIHRLAVPRVELR